MHAYGSAGLGINPQTKAQRSDRDIRDGADVPTGRHGGQENGAEVEVECVQRYSMEHPRE